MHSSCYEVRISAIGPVAAPRAKGDDIASKSELKKPVSAYGELNDDDANPEMFGTGSAKEPRRRGLRRRGCSCPRARRGREEAQDAGILEKSCRILCCRRN
jgi:hypothetical protein